MEIFHFREKFTPANLLEYLNKSNDFFNSHSVILTLDFHKLQYWLTENEFCYYMSKKSSPNLYSNVLYRMGQEFLSRQSDLTEHDFCYLVFHILPQICTVSA